MGTIGAQAIWAYSLALGERSRLGSTATEKDIAPGARRFFHVEPHSLFQIGEGTAGHFGALGRRFARRLLSPRRRGSRGSSNAGNSGGTGGGHRRAAPRSRHGGCGTRSTRTAGSPGRP